MCVPCVNHPGGRLKACFDPDRGWESLKRALGVKPCGELRDLYSWIILKIQVPSQGYRLHQNGYGP